MTFSSPPPTPTEIVHLGSEAITVTGPTNADKVGMDVGLWAHEETLYSPRSDFAAVRFCWDAVKYHGCRVYLARPGAQVTELKNSNVERLLWTQDGEYLLGAGANTLRLWNLSGGMRSAMYQTATGRSTQRIQEWWLVLNGRGRTDLCVSAQDGFRLEKNAAIYTLSTARYRLPTLERLGLNTVQTEAGEAACPDPSR
ncbi:hypothetical protein GCM10017783_15470 [Deinococcus piscis]|uniref:Uncharacterized protein n=1 Tax=Deinococcus piscis TaxID=394230 RepID=A0ABQ3K4V9_9DEIO|nr:hypothetical protein [Deinococcus piscis]GHG03846.1 hypothetical protein GCM10017783_15470 [Deinococcus piscis]